MASPRLGLVVEDKLSCSYMYTMYMHVRPGCNDTMIALAIVHLI